MVNQLIGKKFMKEDFPFFIDRYFHDHDNSEIHGHDFIELVYIVQGQAEHMIEGITYELFAGDVFIINPGEVHKFNIMPGNQVEIINCLFTPKLISNSLLVELEISNSMDFFYVHPFLNSEERFVHRLNFARWEGLEILPLLEAMMREFTQKQTGFQTLIKLRMIELLVLLSRYYGMMTEQTPVSRNKESEIIVQRMCGFLERHYHEKITLQSISRLFNLSTRQINRMFNQHTGTSMIKILQNIRIKRAKILLSDDKEKVINVAMSVGYEDPAFFSRLFLREVGCPPSRYRGLVEGVKG